MIEVVLGKLAAGLRNVRLTLVEWAALSSAAAVGALVLAFRAQGRKLHAAQLDLLKQRLDAKASQADSDAAMALAAYDKVKAEYLKAGGKL